MRRVLTKPQRLYNLDLPVAVVAAYGKDSEQNKCKKIILSAIRQGDFNTSFDTFKSLPKKISFRLVHFSE